MRPFDVSEIRKDFPALKQEIDGHRFVYLDSAASALKPQSVVDRLSHYYALESSNVHRGAHRLADEGTANFEGARKYVASFLGASEVESIIFTKGTTEAINLLADSFVRSFLRPGDEILISDVEHHANIVPWQNACERQGVSLKHIPTLESGLIRISDLTETMTSRTKLVSLTHASNTLGTIQPIREIAEAVHQRGAYLAVDGAQYVPFHQVDVTSLDVDFYCFSTHKVFGPYGHGVLYGKRGLLEQMPPYQGGGSMIYKVDLEKGTSFNDLPFKFEAGTPHIAGAIGLQAGLEYLRQFDYGDIRAHEGALLAKAEKGLQKISGMQIYGRDVPKVPILSFNIEGIHHSDMGSLLDQQGVAVRVGHHCTQPLMKKMNVSGTVRASFSMFNDDEDVEQFVDAVLKAKEMLS